jgi:hypothetical protein
MADTFKEDAPSKEEWMHLLTSVRVAASVLDQTPEQCAEIPPPLAEEVADSLQVNAKYLKGIVAVMLVAADHVKGQE